MTSSPDNTVAEILYEFLNQFKEDGYLAQGNTDNTVESLDSHYLSIFLELVGADELVQPQTPHDVWGKPERKCRNALRAELRTALQDRLGEK